MKKNKKAFIAACFDNLHFGHLHLLKEAKKLADFLVIGINTDEYIKNKKGNDRPIDNINIRINKLCNTGLVDIVQVFDGDSPLKLIKKIKPDYILVGDDYKLDQVIGYPECLEWGGQVKIIKRIDNISTTNLINKKFKNKINT